MLIIKGIYVNLDILLLALINSIFAESGFNHIHEKEKFIYYYYSISYGATLYHIYSNA